MRRKSLVFCAVIFVCLIFASCAFGEEGTLYLLNVGKENGGGYYIEASEERDGEPLKLPLSKRISASFQDPEWVGAWKPEDYTNAAELKRAFDKGKVAKGACFNFLMTDGKISYLAEQSYYESSEDTSVAYIYTDFSEGSPLGDRIYKHEVTFKVTIDVTGQHGPTWDDFANALSELTGLNFDAEFRRTDDYKGLIVDWSPNCSLFTGPIGEQKPEYTFFEHVSLSWFMLDSMWRTIINHDIGEFSVEEVYYTCNGKPLELEFYPPITFTEDLPYMGSPFYAAHADNVGDI